MTTVIVQKTLIRKTSVIRVGLLEDIRIATRAALNDQGRHCSVFTVRLTFAFTAGPPTDNGAHFIDDHGDDLTRLRCRLTAVRCNALLYVVTLTDPVTPTRLLWRRLEIAAKVAIGPRPKAEVAKAHGVSLRTHA
jgi:hypothetical protein